MMKQNYLKTLLLCLLSLVGCTAFAYDCEVNGVYYNLNREYKTASVTSNYSNGYSGVVNIPEEIEYDITYTVTEIGEDAFRNCTSLTLLTIGDNVISIGNGACYGCNNLKEVNIPNSVTNIGNYAFYGCTGLTSITIPDNIYEIGFNAFAYCRGLTSVALPNNVYKIGAYAFWECSGLTSVTISGVYGYIDDYAFGGCTNLEKVIVEDLAAWCYNLFCNSESNPLYYAKHLYSDEETEIKDLVIPHITDIGSNIFSHCEGLTSVVIQKGMHKIGDAVFSGCTNLISASLPEGITQMGISVFQGCSSLTTVDLPDDMTSISGSTFADCRSLTTITLPSSLRTIGGHAFDECTGLTSITIPRSLKNIGKDAFNRCSGLKKVIIEDLVAWCSISFDNSWSNPLLYAEHLYSDEDTEITDLVIPDNVTTISNYAFYSCSSLTSVSLPKYINDIGNYAFCGCSSLATIFSYNNTPPNMGSNNFTTDQYSTVKVFVPQEALEVYQNANRWKEFFYLQGFSSTGIENNIQKESKFSAVYTLDGRKLNITNLSDLSKGIYIINGKKMLVK